MHRVLKHRPKLLIMCSVIAVLSVWAALPGAVFAAEDNLVVPQPSPAQNHLLMVGIVICILGILFAFFQSSRIKKIRAHKSMLAVSNTIYETCKTYLIQQGKFLLILFIFICAFIAFYFGGFVGKGFGGVVFIVMWTIIGMLGSYLVAWYGIRINTMANSRMAFAALERKPIKLLNIPLDSGMSIGLLLICVELCMMLVILLFVPRPLAGASFIGFAIGESLGASALRIAGGIFTKIADIGSDLMKLFFKIKEDDPRNPGVIADCTGDNAGDSVGPTADGFETYGVTGVALISFICLSVGSNYSGAERDILQTNLLTWIFVIRIVMVLTSFAAFFINKALSKSLYGKSDDLDFERPLTNLIWIASILSIAVTFIVSYLMIGPGSEAYAKSETLWYTLAIIVSCGTLGAALIPELTKVFTSGKSKHVKETVENSKNGGASLNILSGLVSGNFSAFWIGMLFFALMFIAYTASRNGLGDVMEYESIFAFGLVAFGFLSMGPVTIAVDSYGPVTDNAQSIYELSLIEEQEGISEEIEKEFGFKPDFEKAKHYLEANDGCGNTFKATAKPVLIGTAVVGSTIMIFSLILIIKNTLGIDPTTVLNFLNPYAILGLICGGSVIYWFTGASTQAVTAGAYKAVEYIRDNIELDENADMKASTEKSKEVVKICTQYAQNGMFNIFIAIFCFTVAFAFISAPSGRSEPVMLFIAYLIGLAVFGLFQAVFMANAGGCWDNSKKVVEVDMKEKGTPIHEATVVGDTVGDPFKDTSAVALNPIIKFTTLFGTLTMELAITNQFVAIAPYIGIVFLAIAIIFVWRSFYRMRISR